MYHLTSSFDEWVSSVSKRRIINMPVSSLLTKGIIMKLLSILSVGVATVGMTCLLGYASAANSAPGDLIADGTMAPGGRQGGTPGETGRADKGTPNERTKQGTPGDTKPGAEKQTGTGGNPGSDSGRTGTSSGSPGSGSGPTSGAGSGAK
jgi:hypothetical protein